MRVLLADDQTDVRSALRLILEQELGICVIEEVTTTTTLLRHVALCHPDVILLDWELPGLDTPGMLKRLHTNTSRSKIIVLSGRPEGRQAALDAGADAFVSKIDPPEYLLKLLYDVFQDTSSASNER